MAPDEVERTAPRDALEELLARPARRADASFAFACRHPRLAGLRVRLLTGGVVGYLAAWTVGLAVLPIALFLTAGLVSIWLTVVAWLAAPVVASCLRVRVPGPTGYAIGAKDAPELAARIDAARRVAGAPLPRSVLLQFEGCGVGISQRPVILGVFGPSEISLVIGLPTVFALSDEEFVAQLVHAFAAAAGQHGRAGRRIVRALQRWPLVAARMSDWIVLDWIGIPLRALLARVEVHGTALCRAHQLAADARAGLICRPAAFAAGVARLSLVERQSSARLWAPLLAGHELPPAGTLRAICEHAKLDVEETDDAVSDLIAERHETNAWDASYAERVGALDVTDRQLRFELAMRGAQDDALLTEASRWLPLVEETWLAAVAPAWAQERKRVQGRIERLEFLDRLEQQGHLKGDLVGERVRLAAEYRPALDYIADAS